MLNLGWNTSRGRIRSLGQGKEDSLDSFRGRQQSG